MLTSYFFAFLIFENPPPPPTEFLTIETLFTAAGSTTAVFAVTSVIHGLWPKVSPRWIAAVFSLILMIVAIHVNHQGYAPATFLLAFINAAIVYAAAVGVNNITTAPGSRAPGLESTGRSFRWWP